MPQHPSWIIAERDKALQKLHLALAAEMDVAVAKDVIAPAQRWRVVEEAERRYRDWSLRSQSRKKPILRGKADVALANLYAIDHSDAP